MAQTPQVLPNPSFSLSIDSIADRVRGAITFHRWIIAGIAADRRATVEAGVVVALVGLATAIGDRDHLANGIVNALIGWAMLTGAIWYLATHMLGTPAFHADFQPLLRTIGYALAPVALGIIGFVWVLGPMVSAVGTMWAFLATIAAVRYTTRFGWGRSFALTLAAGIAVAIVGFLLSLVTGLDPHVW
jgi:hypothetical protein